MSSALQSALTSLQENDYVTRMFILKLFVVDIDVNLIAVAIITAVGYDYGELYVLFRNGAINSRTVSPDTLG